MELIALIAMLGSLFTLIILVHCKDYMKSTYIISLAIAVSLYMIGNYIEISSSSLEGGIIGLKIRFLGMPFIPTLWYFCVREFCGIKPEKKYTFLFFLIVPLSIAYLLFTWEHNSLLISGVEYIDGNNAGNLRIIPGVLFTGRLFYQYGVNLLGVLTLIFCYMRGTKNFKKQSVLLFASILIPVFNVATYTVKVGSYNIDLTPYCLLVSMVVFVITLYRFGIFNLSNIIRENAMNSLDEGVLFFGHDGIFMDSNDSARKIFPQLNKAKIGTSIYEMDYLPFNSLTMNEGFIQSNSSCEFTREYDGIIKTFNISMSNVHIGKKLVGYSLILNNITPLKNLLATLEEKSVMDALTGIYNRGYLFEAGKNNFENAKRRHESLSVIMFDIDFFKKVNDTFGHIFGDYVLKTIASVCAVSLRKSDLLARYGGEEFCVLLPNTDIEGARGKAESLRVKISRHMFEYNDMTTYITSSFGVATYSPEDNNFLDIVRSAPQNSDRYDSYNST